MTLNNFLTENKSKFKALKKLNVRDLEELEKNTIVAYVDEAEDSFDVQIVFDSKKNIKETSCDCIEGGICKHIVAFANFIFENKTEKSIVKKASNKKLSETNTILEAVTDDDLRIWVSELLKKNSEIAFAFKNQFGSKTIEVSKENIDKAIQDCISSVIGKRKKCETNEVKKIVDALNVSLKPYLDILFSKVNNENYRLIKHINYKLEDFNYNYYLTSTRVTKLIENLVDLQLKSLFNIKDTEEWQKATKFYLNIIFKAKFAFSELEFIMKIYEYSKTNELQHKFIITFLEENINNLYKNLDEEYLIAYELENFFLIVFSENKLTEKYIHYFKPRRFKNEHNLLLILELIKANQTELAEKYCLEQIGYNFEHDYDLPYVKQLIHIYKKNNETKKLANILGDYGKYMFSIDDYLFIKENAEVEKFKKYRQAVLTNARIAYQSGDLEAFEFYYEIKKLDFKNNDLFEMLKNSGKIIFIDKYKEIALKIDKEKFLNLIFGFYSFYNSNPENIESIVNYICENVDREYLKIFMKHTPIQIKNKFFIMIEKKLQ